MYRAVLLCNILFIAILVTASIAEDAKCSWDETPVSCASTAWFDIARERGVKSWDELTDEQKTAIIDQHYVEGQLATQDWFESARLFDAACFLAEENADAEARARLLMIALKAAEHTLKENPDVIEIGLTASGMEPIDEWFCGSILRLIQHPGTASKYPAIGQYNVYRLQKALGDQKAARAAIEDAYTMCPKDAVIGNAVREMRTKMKDFGGAIQVVTDDEKPTMEVWQISSEATNAQRMGDIHLKAGELDKASSELLKAWDALDRLQKKKEELEFVGVPIVEMSRNRCATSLGLIALQKGQVEEARRWLKASLTHDMFMEYKGYDVRLVKKAVSVPALKEECAEYLKAASVLGTDKMKEEAFSMLKKLCPGVQKKDLPGISPEASVPKRIIKASTKCTDGEKALSSGDLERARRLLDKVWAECEKMLADEKLAEVAYREGIAYLRNRCATFLGVVAHENADLERAVRWLRASAMDADKGHPPKRYHLELVEKLSWEPSLRADCIEYLELATKTGPDDARAKAKELLTKLTESQPGSSRLGAASELLPEEHPLHEP